MRAGLVEDLNKAYSEGQGGRGTLDYLRIVSEPAQIAAQYRRMLSEMKREYVEFSRPPYAVDPLDEQIVNQARSRGVSCRLLYEARSMDDMHRQRMDEYRAAGVEVYSRSRLPMKLAVFDGRQGMIALLDPVITKPSWTALVFDHPGFAEAMRGLFEGYWARAIEIRPKKQPPDSSAPFAAIAPGHTEVEDRALARHALQPHAAAVVLDDLSTDS